LATSPARHSQRSNEPRPRNHPIRGTNPRTQTAQHTGTENRFYPRNWPTDAPPESKLRTSKFTHTKTKDEHRCDGGPDGGRGRAPATDLAEVPLVGVEVVDVDVLLRVPPALAPAAAASPGGRRRHCRLAAPARHSQRGITNSRGGEREYQREMGGRWAEGKVTSQDRRGERPTSQLQRSARQANARCG
jgi:hypothetical protein